MRYFQFEQIQVGSQKYSNGHISATGDPIHFMFGSGMVFIVGGSNDAISGSIKSMVATGRHLTAASSGFLATARPSCTTNVTPCILLVCWDARHKFKQQRMIIGVSYRSSVTSSLRSI